MQHNYASEVVTVYYSRYIRFQDHSCAMSLFPSCGGRCIQSQFSAAHTLLGSQLNYHYQLIVCTHVRPNHHHQHALPIALTPGAGFCCCGEGCGRLGGCFIYLLFAEIETQQRLTWLTVCLTTGGNRFSWSSEYHKFVSLAESHDTVCALSGKWWIGGGIKYNFGAQIKTASSQSSRGGGILSSPRHCLWSQHTTQ